MTAPTKPTGLDRAGIDLWKRVTRELAADDLVLGARDYRYLEDACRIADSIAALEAAHTEAGSPATAKGSQGQLVIHPIIGELRQQRSTLAALLARVDMSVDEALPIGRGGRTTPQAARAAAYARHQRVG